MGSGCRSGAAEGAWLQITSGIVPAPMGLWKRWWLGARALESELASESGSSTLLNRDKSWTPSLTGLNDIRPSQGLWPGGTQNLVAVSYSELGIRKTCNSQSRPSVEPNGEEFSLPLRWSGSWSLSTGWNSAEEGALGE